MPICVKTGDVQVFPRDGGASVFEEKFSAEEKAKIREDVEKIKKLPEPSTCWIYDARDPKGRHSKEKALEELKRALNPPEWMLGRYDILFTRVVVSRKGRGFDYHVSVRKTDEGSHSSSPTVELFYSSKDLKKYK